MAGNELLQLANNCKPRLCYGDRLRAKERGEEILRLVRYSKKVQRYDAMNLLMALRDGGYKKCELQELAEELFGYVVSYDEAVSHV